MNRMNLLSFRQSSQPSSLTSNDSDVSSPFRLMSGPKRTIEGGIKKSIDNSQSLMDDEEEEEIWNYKSPLLLKSSTPSSSSSSDSVTSHCVKSHIGTRDYQEDRSLVKKFDLSSEGLGAVHLWLVADGHGGQEFVDALIDKLPESLRHQLILWTRNDSIRSHESMQRNLKRFVMDFDFSMMMLSPNLYGGCTLIFTLYIRSQDAIYVVNVGDSRVCMWGMKSDYLAQGIVHGYNIMSLMPDEKDTSDNYYELPPASGDMRLITCTIDHKLYNAREYQRIFEPSLNRGALITMADLSASSDGEQHVIKNVKDAKQFVSNVIQRMARSKETQLQWELPIGARIHSPHYFYYTKESAEKAQDHREQHNKIVAGTAATKPRFSLNLARSMGDYQDKSGPLGYTGNKGIISAEPDIYLVDLKALRSGGGVGSDSSSSAPDIIRLVLGSDGVWDIIKTSNLIRNAPTDNRACEYFDSIVRNRLQDYSQQRPPLVTDNLTFISCTIKLSN